MTEEEKQIKLKALKNLKQIVEFMIERASLMNNQNEIDELLDRLLTLNQEIKELEN